MPNNNTLPIVNTVGALAPRLAGLSGQQVLDLFMVHGLQVVFSEQVAGRSCYRRGDLVLYRHEMRAEWRGKKVRLTPFEFRVVDLLSAFGFRHFSYRDIYNAVRGEGFAAGGDQGFEINVRSIVKRLRVKFREVDPLFDMVENVSGFGYTWASVRGQIKY